MAAKIFYSPIRIRIISSYCCRLLSMCRSLFLWPQALNKPPEFTGTHILIIYSPCRATNLHHKHLTTTTAVLAMALWFMAYDFVNLITLPIPYQRQGSDIAHFIDEHFYFYIFFVHSLHTITSIKSYHKCTQKLRL